MPPKNNPNVNAFLKRIVELASMEVTSYGTLNPWKVKPKEHSSGKSLKPDTGIYTLEGEIGPGIATPYSINGTDVVINHDTMVVGDLSLGALARVKVGKGGKARTIVITTQ